MQCREIRRWKILKRRDRRIVLEGPIYAEHELQKD